MINFRESDKSFHLSNGKISYVFKVLRNNELAHIYFGENTKFYENLEHLLDLKQREIGITPSPFMDQLGFAPDILRQEYPSYGRGDYREPAIEIEDIKGSRIVNFQYKEHEILNGKPKVRPLPTTYASEGEAQTLKIILEDSLLNLNLILFYTIFKDYSVITRRVEIKNNSNNKIKINRIFSASLDFKKDNYKVLYLTGTHCRERQLTYRKVEMGKIEIDSKRGTSSANYNPFIALLKEETGEHQGEVWGFNLIYSGNFVSQVEENQYGFVRVNMGINHFDFSWILEANESFQAPELVLVYSNKGLNSLSQTYHKLYQNHLIRSEYKFRERDVLLNNWEATYFDFNEEQILKLAKEAAEKGIELFVLDDGWFGERNDDSKSLGDWFVNKEKIPSGIANLAKKINALGLNFGIWLEPEMVNKDSNLYREHPDWILHVPGREATPSRKQHVLDFSREEVVEYIYKVVSKLLREANISYVKWDMNRCMTEIYSVSRESERQKETAHRYILGLYSLLERLTRDFPSVLFESCASGGNRFDPAMLYYMPQTWTSDNTDAIDRIKIQYGTSICYPISSISAHVSASPNHQNGRITDIETRAAVAFFGVFGYELDITKLNSRELEKLKEQVSFYKKHRKTLLFGTFYRLSEDFNSNEHAFLSVNEEKTLAILGVFKVLSLVNPYFYIVKLRGLDENKLYIINDREKSYGSELMNFGLKVFKDEGRDFQAQIYVIRDCNS